MVGIKSVDVHTFLCTMEKTHIPTWAETKEKPYNRRTKIDHFIYEHDPGSRSEDFRRMLSEAIEQEKRGAIKSARANNKRA